MKKFSIIVLALILPIMVFGSILGLRPLSIFSMNHNHLRDSIYVPATILQKEMVDGEWELDSQLELTYLPYHHGKPQLERSTLYMEWDGELIFSVIGEFEYYPNQLCSGFSAGVNIPDEGTIELMRGMAEYDHQDRITKFEMFSDLEDVHQRIEIEYLSNIDIKSYVLYQEVDFTEYQDVEIALDSQNRMYSQTVYASPDSLNWAPDGRMTFLYHDQDTSTIEDFIRHISDNMVMLMLFGGDMMYGMVTDFTESTWQEPIWKAYHKYIYDYDADLQMTSKKWYRYDDEPHKNAAKGWTYYYRDSYTYDQHGNSIQELGEHYFEGEYYADWLTEISYQMLTDNHDAASPAIEPIKLSVYPQPFATSVNIRGESKAGGELTIDIFNLKGQKLKSLVLPSGMNFTWDGKDASGKSLPSSVYLIRASQDGKSSSKKVIKIK